MWTAIRRRARQKSKVPRHYVIGSGIVLWALYVVYLLVSSFLHLPATLQLSQRCRMSRMWPSYIPYNAPSPSGLSKKYRLFLYREAYPGRIKEEDEPRGRPALFIPGNAGSFGQVRSVASSAHHLYKSGQGGDGVSEVDWWTVDFNEDFSAFHGQTMHDQAEYINEVLRFLLNKYPSTRRIPILAHSMGGIVARLMMLKDSHPLGSVDTIITLSSPHAYPPVPLDGGVEQVYDQINSQWGKTAQNTLLISLSGGILDNQLSSEPASLPLARIWYQNTSLSAFTSSLSGLWSGVDHLAMMWCDQLRERIARGVLRTEGRDIGLAKRRDEWRRVLGIEQEGQVTPLSDERLSPDESKEGHTVSTYAVADAGQHQNAFELIVDLPVGLDTSFGPPIDQEAKVRVDLCSKDAGKVSCQHVLPSAYDLYPPSPHITKDDAVFPLFPSAEERYEAPGHGLRRLYISLDHLKAQQIDHVRVERRKASEGLLIAGWAAPTTMMTESLSFAGSIDVPLEKVPESTSPSISTIVTDMDSSLLAYDLTILASKQFDALCHLKSSPLLRAQSLSTGDTQYYPSIRLGSKFPLTLHSTSPYMPPAHSLRRGTKFTLLLDTCSQITGVSVSINWKASMGLLLSRYRTALGSLPLAALLMLMSVMLEEWDQGAAFSSLTTASVQYAPYLAPLLVLASALLSTFQRVAALLSSSERQHSPYLQNSTFGLATSSLITNIILGILFLTASYGLCLLVSVLLNFFVSVIASLLRLAGAKAGFRSVEHSSDGSTSRLRSTIISFAVLAAIIWLAVPIQFVFLVLFLVQLYCAIEAHLAAVNKKEGDDTSRANQQALLLNLYFWLLPSNAPALLIWSRNLLRGYFGVLGGPDHNVFRIIGFLAISHISSSGELLQRSRSR
jgi:glycosylphosphatidylinositol deacylase